MKRGSSTTRTGRQGLTPKSGQILMLNSSQRGDVRTLALDRQHGGSRRGLQTGTTPLKSRPILVNDLSIFELPRVQRKRTKSRHVDVTCHSITELASARSNRSRKSSRSAKPHRSTMKRHASALAGGRRKKAVKVHYNLKPAPKPKPLRQSRSRKSLKKR